LSKLSEAVHTGKSMALLNEAQDTFQANLARINNIKINIGKGRQLDDSIDLIKIPELKKIYETENQDLINQSSPPSNEDLQKTWASNQEEARISEDWLKNSLVEKLKRASRKNNHEEILKIMIQLEPYAESSGYYYTRGNVREKLAINRREHLLAEIPDDGHLWDAIEDKKIGLSMDRKENYPNKGFYIENLNLLEYMILTGDWEQAEYLARILYFDLQEEAKSRPRIRDKLFMILKEHPIHKNQKDETLKNWVIRAIDIIPKSLIILSRYFLIVSQILHDRHIASNVELLEREIGELKGSNCVDWEFLDFLEYIDSRESKHLNNPDTWSLRKKDINNLTRKIRKTCRFNSQTF